MGAITVRNKSFNLKWATMLDEILLLIKLLLEKCTGTVPRLLPKTRRAPLHSH